MIELRVFIPFLRVFCAFSARSYRLTSYYRLSNVFTVNKKSSW